MRFLIHSGMTVALSVGAIAQATSPSWPKIPMASCPAVAPSDQSQRTWNHGQLEQDSFNAAIGAFQAKKYVEAAVDFANFADRYPDSDYKETALASELVAESYSNNKSGMIDAAAKIAQLPAASAASQEVAFVTLSDTVSPYVRPDDPEEARKLADLERWTHCGEEALAARLSAMPAATQPASEKATNLSRLVFKRTAGFVAYMRQDYAKADEELEAASKINPDDARTYLWLGATQFVLSPADLNGGITAAVRFFSRPRLARTSFTGTYSSFCATLISTRGTTSRHSGHSSLRTSLEEH